MSAGSMCAIGMARLRDHERSTLCVHCVECLAARSPLDASRLRPSPRNVLASPPRT